MTKILLLMMMMLMSLMGYWVNGSPVPSEGENSILESKVAFITDNEDISLLGIVSNVTSTPEGDPIFEGDIVLLKERAAEINITEKELTGRTAIAEPVLYWPNGVIPYSYHRSVSDGDKEVIESAMRHWEEETCITFRPASSIDFMYLRFRTDTPGCWSLVGRQFLRFGVGQDISIGQGCAQTHVVAHEIGHAVGFFHEQSRADRDTAIAINWDNVQQGYGLQFNKEEDVNFGYGYDYTSVMQYPSWAFSKKVLEKNTIVTLDPRYQRLLGKNQKGLSFRDKAIINNVYGCNDNCPNRNQVTCLNQGYLAPYRNDGRNCPCNCPPNTEGATCEKVMSDDYYEAKDPLLCGGNVTTEGVLMTPGYPVRSSPKQSCSWNIIAPDNKLVRLTFDGFTFAPRHNKPGTKTDGKCYHEAVEIRLGDPFNGDHYCGTDIESGTKMDSPNNQAIIIVLADDKMVGTGLKVNVQFLDKEVPTTTASPNESSNRWGGGGGSGSGGSRSTPSPFEQIWINVMKTWGLRSTTTMKPKVWTRNPWG